MSMKYKFLLVIGGSLFLGSQSMAQVDEVNIYAERKEELIKPLLDKFTAETGIKVNLVTGEGDALIKRLEIEGKDSLADILLANDVARLYLAKYPEFFQPVQSHIPVS